MRPLSQNAVADFSAATHPHLRWLQILVIVATAAHTAGCTGGTGSSVTVAPPTPTPPPPTSVSVIVTPAIASVLLGTPQAFNANVTGTTDTRVSWSVNNIPGGSASTGFITAAGIYTAPQILPTLAGVTITAQSTADSSKQASAAITILSDIGIALTPSAIGVELGAMQPFHAAITSAGQPDTAIRWSLSGLACPAACGTLDANGNFTAPLTPPNPNIVTISITPQADPSKKAQAAITIQPGVGVSLSPGIATLSGNHRVTLTAQVFGSANSAVTWTVNGIANGSGTFGQICIVASNPCQPLAAGINLQVDYQSPGAVPAPNPVTIRATSVADTTRSATAQITIINHDVVTVLPSSAMLAPLAVQQFVATVLGTANQNVVWQIQGAACSVAGACGAIDANGIYIAPGSAPSPNAFTVVATSADDPLQSGSANVAIAFGANILALHPASVYAGAANGFTVRVDGSNFAASAPGPGSVLLIAGIARTTTCNSVTECTAPVTPTDVANAGSLSAQIRNPDNTTSNSVSLIIAAPNVSDELISLTSTAPAATAKDIVVVDPTTAGVSLPNADVDLNVAALGAFSTVTNSCVLAGNPVPLLRPSSGLAAADICLFSAGGLDTSMTYTMTGPGDVSVIAKQPAGLGIVHLTLQVSATAIPGARTLFIQNTNLDKTAATGALEVQ